MTDLAAPTSPAPGAAAVLAAPARGTIPAVRAVVTVAAAVALGFCWLGGRAVVGAVRTDVALSWSGTAQLALMLLLCGGSALLALALAWLAEDRAESRALALCLALLAFGPAADVLAGQVVRPLFGSAWRDATYFLRDVAMVLGAAALVRFTALFPSPIAAPDLAPGPLHRVRAAFLDADRLWATGGIVSVGIPAALLGAEWAAGRAAARRLLPLEVAVGLFALVLAVSYLRTPRPALDAEARRRRDWVLQGFVAATAVLLVASSLKLVQMIGGYAILFQGWYVVALALGLDLLVVFVAVAMFYHGAFDPRLAICGTAVAGLVGTALVFLFVGVEQVLEDTLQGWLGFGDRAGGILTGGIVALSFEPLKVRVTRLVERLLGRDGDARRQ